MFHWCLTPATVQTIVENLDRNLMTLSAAKNYFQSYGLEIPGQTKQAFIRNLCRLAAQKD